MVEPSKPRSHGQTGAEEEAHEKGKELDTVMQPEAEIPMSLTRAYQRMKLDWNSKDAEVMVQVKELVDDFIFEHFQDAFAIEYKIWDIVREPERDPDTGYPKTDPSGLTIWKRRPDGSYVEDWSKMNSVAREALLYEIMTRLFTWELEVAEIKGEALFAKAIWEQAFATGFDEASSDKKTVEARSAHGTRVSIEHRFFGIFKSMCYEKAQAVVRSMDRICQRIKDLHV